MKLPWRRDADGHRISAYLDGELDQTEELELADRLVFDQNLRERMADVRQVDAMAIAALSVDPVPDSAATAERLVAEIDSTPVTPLASARNLKPALYASVGILLTVGITFVGLRRRGLV